MRLQLPIEEKSDLHRLQHNLVGTPDYVCITCILMFDNGHSPNSSLQTLTSTSAQQQSTVISMNIRQAVLNFCLRTATMDIGVCLAAIR